MTDRSLVDVPTQHLFGLDFANAAAVDDLAERLADGREADPSRWRCVVTPNVDHLVRYRRYGNEASVARHASLVLPDGMPIVWASRLLGRPLVARLTDVNRDKLWPVVAALGQRPVRQVALDEVWSALRFRPKAE